MRRLWSVLGWFVVVDALITMFGVTTAPLLLAFAADIVVKAYAYASGEINIL